MKKKSFALIIGLLLLVYALVFAQKEVTPRFARIERPEIVPRSKISDIAPAKPWPSAGMIKGRVTDTEIPKPNGLIGATVTVKSVELFEGARITKTTKSDIGGNYEIYNLPPGEYVMTTSKLGYDTAEDYVTVTPGGEAFHDVRLLYEVDTLLRGRTRWAMRVGANAAIVHNGSILLAEFKDRDGRHFNLPGSVAHEGESIHDALRRGVREQVSAEIEVGRLLLVWEYEPLRYEAKYGHVRKLGLIFLCKLRQGDKPQLPATPEYDQVGVNWLPITELSSAPLLPRIAKRLIAALQSSETEDIFYKEI